MDFAQNLKDEHQQSLLRYDKIIYLIIMAHLPVTMFLIPIGHETGLFAIISSIIVGLIASAAYFSTRGSRIFGIISAVLIMTLSAIMIQTQMGRIEMHFHIFSALALLLIYRDWLVIVTAAAVIAVHHLLFTALQLGGVEIAGMPITIYNYGCSWGIAFLHAAFVVFESAILVYYAVIMKKEETTAQMLIAAVRRIQNDNDLTIHIDDDEGENAVAVSFNAMVGKFKQLVADLHATTEQLNNMSQQLTGISQRAHSNISVQHEQTEHVATAMTEMSTSIMGVAENAHQAADTARQATQDAKVGVDIVNKAINMTSSLIESMGKAADSMRQLDVSAQSIGSFVDVISGISEQTNLLALNAAIEAARAGEQGRGFAVVADEVRTLAQRTQESTSEIQSIIESLQSVTTQAVKTIKDGQDKTGKTSDEIGRAGDSLQSIFSGISNINMMNTQIATAAEEQSSVAESITRNIISISDLSKDTVHSFQDNERSAQSLQQLASDLKNKIFVFKN